MKLNLRMIMDLLDIPVDHISGNPDSAPKLIDIYPYIPERNFDTPGVLYLISWEQLQKSSFIPKDVICIGGGTNSLTFCTDHAINGLIFDERNQSLFVLREIQEIFTKYYNHERKLLDTLLANEPIHNVLNACAIFMECHVTLYDSELNLIDYSDIYLPPDDDQIWKDTLSAKRSVMPMIPREKVVMMPSDPYNYPRSTFLDIGGGVPHHINIAFDYGDSRVATLIFCEVSKPLTKHHLWLVDMIADLMHATIIEQYNTFLDVRNYFRTSVTTTLRYSTVDSTFLHANLSRLGWNAKDDYQILLVQLPPEDRKISHYLYNYENVFAGSYSDCVALRYEEFIFILLHDDACTQLNHCLSALKKQLTMDNGICSVGLRFCNFSQLNIQYDLAKLPLLISTKKNKRIRYYRDVMETHLIHELSSCFPLRDTCHHAAIRIHDYDAVNGTDFLLTLETYLMNNKSLMTASEKLFIHRSTLTYRLKSIEKLAPMQLDDPCERLHILLSCIALRILCNSAPSSNIDSDST